ncbi:MAG: Do family serine endopeptidase [Micavibrio sp.]|nr:Do family serine endopeptidase [Micavibrio sp.]
MMKLATLFKTTGLAAALALALFISAPARADGVVPQNVGQMQLSFSPIVKRTSPAVVNIYTKRVVQQQVNPLFNDPFFSQFFGMQGMGRGMSRERTENSLGSGVVIDPTGKIATNTHVIANATEIIVVTNDGHEYTAKKVLVDEKTDLAVLSIDPKGAQLPYLELADSDALEVGDLVLAIGNPFGVGQTVTSGIVSALARTGMGNNDYGYFIQTDAAINPGNSGGALVDMQGRLVGINSMIFSRDGGSLGIGFAIPSNMLRTVADAAHNGGKIIRPWTGISGQAVQPEMVESLGLSAAQGMLVSAVAAGGPAAKAGVQAGDVILSLNGRVVASPEALKYMLATQALGTPANLKIFRKGKTADAVMTTEAPPEVPPRDTRTLQGRNPLAGASVANISPAVTEEVGNITRDSGVIVLAAESGNAARLGLARGDIILSVNGVVAGDVKTLQATLAAGSRGRWQIQVLRGTQVMNLLINL